MGGFLYTVNMDVGWDEDKTRIFSGEGEGEAGCR